MEDNESTVVSKGPCSDCSSSDACATYTDGHTHCFSCGAHHNPTGTIQRKAIVSSHPDLIDEIEFASLTKRRLTEDTCKKWGYGLGTLNGSDVQIANYCDDSGKTIAQKVRFANKDFVILGDAKNMGLYGQHLWRDGGKLVVVTEGELDALSMSQMQDNKWPVVSVPTGAQGAKKAIARSLDWLEKFEKVVFMFDMDEPGQSAAKACADLLTPGKAAIASLPLKDASDMLQAGRGAELIGCMWGAKTHRPDGIISGVDLWEKMIEEDKRHGIAWPFMGMNKMLNPCEKGRIYTFTAGTGIGKSEVVRQISHYFLKVHGEPTGYVALEESVKRTAQGFVGLELGKRIHIADRNDATQEELRSAFDATVGSGKLFLYDHWGSTDSDNLISKIRYLARGCGCETIILDHLSIVVSGIDSGDERRIIDNTMTKLRSLTEELQIRMLLISHLKRPEGRGHEDGAQTSLSQLRGSAAIGQLSDAVIGLERNQQDPARAEYTLFRVLKNRITGETGECLYAKYDKSTGRIQEVENPDAGESEEAEGVAQTQSDPSKPRDF